MKRSIQILLLTILLPVIARAAAPATKPAIAPGSAAVESEMIRRSDGATHHTPTTAEANASRSVPVNSLDGTRVAMSLGLVIGVIVAARFAMKKLFPAVSVGRNSQVIRVVSRSVVGPKQQFLLVQLGKRLVLVGDSGASMNALAQIDDADEVASLIGDLQSESANSSMSAFASIFKKTGSEFKREDERALANQPAESTKDFSDDVGENSEPESDRELVAAAGEVNDLMDRVRRLTKRVRQT